MTRKDPLTWNTIALGYTKQKLHTLLFMSLAAFKKPYCRTFHGHIKEDPYHWLRSANWTEVMRDPSKLEPQIRAYLEAENKNADTTLTSLDSLKKELFDEIKGRIKEDDTSPPTKDGPYEYYTRYVKGAEYLQVIRRPVSQQEQEQILHDGNQAAKEHSYYSFTTEHSPNHALMMLIEDTTGSEECRIRFKNIERGNFLEDLIQGTSGDVEWSQSAKAVYYTRLDQNYRAKTLYRHILGTNAEEDTLVFEETRETFQLSLSKTRSERFIEIISGDSAQNEVWLIDAHNDSATPWLVEPAHEDMRYSLEEQNGQLFILTNAGEATDFKIVHTTIDHPGMTHWKDWLPHKLGRRIAGLDCFQDFITWIETEQALPKIQVYNLQTKQTHTITQDGPAFALGMGGTVEFKSEWTRYSYESPTTPCLQYDYNMRTRERRLIKVQEIPSGHKPKHYICERFFAEGHDGAQIPITVLRHKETKLTGATPLFLTGYGSYGISRSASFSISKLSLAQRGFICATAHVRGGMEMGYAWYDKGRRTYKNNTFMDFISCAEHLIDKEYTAKGEIAIQGGSAGGMLVTAATNMRPDLWRAVCADVPFVDVLETILDPGLPLTPGEWSEWGNPIQDKEAYETILSYSPIDNVKAQNYPHIFVTAGVSDPRVTYWEPAKYVATLRERRLNDNLLLLKTNMKGGHFGQSGRWESLQEIAEQFAFILFCFDKN